MTISDCENIVKLYFESYFSDFQHSRKRTLIVNNSNYRLIPDDKFYRDNEMILIEYENTKRPVESISKYWWLLKNTDWIRESIKIKLLIIGLNESQKGIRGESVEILGVELELQYPNNFTFRYVPWDNVSEKEILLMLKQITK